LNWNKSGWKSFDAKSADTLLKWTALFLYAKLKIYENAGKEVDYEFI